MICKCGNTISPERLEVLPNTRVCVKCSKEQKYVGMMSFEHKTAPSLIYVRADDKEAVEILKRSYRRARN